VYREITEDATAPLYHRMKTWILLGSALEDWDESNDCYPKAQSMWHIVRRWHRSGENAETDTAMEELRGELEGLEEALAKRSQHMISMRRV